MILRIFLAWMRALSEWGHRRVDPASVQATRPRILYRTEGTQPCLSTHGAAGPYYRVCPYCHQKIGRHLDETLMRHEYIKRGRTL